MKIAVIGDTHCKNSRLKDYLRMNQAVVKQLKTINPDLIVLLGDDADKHSTVHSIELKTIYEFISELSTISKVIKLIGNHELLNNRCLYDKIHHFHGFNNICTVVDEPMIIDNMLFMPYTPVGEFNNIVNSITQPYSSVFAHQELRGVKVGNKESTVDDVWLESQPMLISGHIHDYQQPQANLIYPGVPSPITFAETTHNIAVVENNVVNIIQLDDVTLYETFTSTLDDVAKVKYDKDNKNRIIVNCTLGDMKAFKTSKTYKKIIEDGVYIVPKIIYEDLDVQQHAKRKSFMECLQEAMDEETSNMFRMIGGV
jgi:DNA repair exonuclease SbcCD nuclease subunit